MTQTKHLILRRLEEGGYTITFPDGYNVVQAEATFATSLPSDALRRIEEWMQELDRPLQQAASGGADAGDEIPF